MIRILIIHKVYFIHSAISNCVLMDYMIHFFHETINHY